MIMVGGHVAYNLSRYRNAISHILGSIQSIPFRKALQMLLVKIPCIIWTQEIALLVHK
jgi:hypothetical protein